MIQNRETVISCNSGSSIFSYYLRHKKPKITSFSWSL